MSSKLTESPAPNPATPEDPTVQSPEQSPDFENSELLQSKSRWRFVMPALIILAILGGVGWIVFNRIIFPILMFSQMKPQFTEVELTTPSASTLDDASEYAASLDSRQSVTLQPRVNGQVAAIYVRPGDRVQQGQQLLQIDAANQQAQVASRSAAAATARADIEAARADVSSANDTLRSLQARRAAAASTVQLNQQEYDRYLSLYNEGASSRQILDQKLNALQTAQADLQRVDADIQAQRGAVSRAQATVSRNQRLLQQAQANVAEGQAELRFYSIAAPFTGVVGTIPAKVGDVVSPSTPLMTLTQNDQLEVQIQVPLERSADLRPGLTVQLLDNRDRVIKTGQISFIAPNVDPTTQSVQAKAVFSNAGNTLRTAQFVRTRVIWAKRPGLTVPVTAISRLGGRDFLFIAKPFKDSGCEAPASGGFGGPIKVEPTQLTAVQTQVELGKIVGNSQEITKGLNAGDRIVSSGILQLQNCTPINAAQPKASPAAPQP